MKIAIPMAGKNLCMHFGHCEQFAIIEADEAARTIQSVTLLTPPPHEPGLLPRWIAEHGVSLVIAGGMGARAQQLFAERNIVVLTGAPTLPPEELVNQWLHQTLELGNNVCDH